MIRTHGLTRHFRVKKATVHAVRGIDLDIEEGELVAFLGPNGAGKSTTLRMLTTLLPPSGGTAVVAGHDVARKPDAVRRAIGYVGQGNGAGQNHRVRDELVTQGRAYGLDRASANERADELLASLDLTDLATRGAATLSGGQKRRVDIALGLVHRPRLLFLDEPSTGLDPNSRAQLWEHVARVRCTHGSTLILTTHYLEEADTMAERVIVIDQGRIIADGTPERLKADLAGDLVTLTAARADDVSQVAAAARRVHRAHEVTVRDATVSLRVRDGDMVLPALVRSLDLASVEVSRADLRRPTLDDVFRNLTGRALDAELAAEEVVAA